MIGHDKNPFIRFPAISLAISVLLAVPLLWSLTRFRVSSETRVLLEGDQRNLSSYEKVKQILADVEVVVISMECDEVFSSKGIDAVRRVSQAFEGRQGVVDVKSLTHSYKPVRRGLTFAMVPLVSTNLSEAELTELKRFSLEHPLVRNLMVAPDSRHTVITVTYQRDLTAPENQRALRDEIETALAPFQGEGLKFRTIALPLVEEEIRSSLRADVLKFVPAAIALLVGILTLTFRSWRILVLMLANQLAVAALVPGAIAMSGFSLNVFSVMLLPLLLGLHLALLTHVFTSYEQARHSASESDAALLKMLEQVFKPSVFAAVTTAIGLLSLASSDVRQVREFGFLGAGGLCLIFFMTFGPGIALLKLAGPVWFRPRLNARGAESIGSGPATRYAVLAEWVADFALRRKGSIMGLTLASAALASLGFGAIRTDIRAVEFLNRSSPTRQAVEEMDRVYGGVNIVQIEIDSGVANGANQIRFLRFVETVHEFTEAQTEISSVYSYAQLLAMMNQIWEGERPDSFKLPESPFLINLFVLALKSQNFPFLTALADASFRTAYLVVRTRDMPSEQYLDVLRKITDFAKATAPEGVSVSAAKGIHSILEADRRIIRSQLSSAGITLGVIGLVLALLWRSVLLAALALVTNLIPISLTMAVAGIADVPLNSITIMVAAISLGIAVDDSIHFITHWRDLRRAGLSPRAAMVETFRIKGPAIVFTSLILVAIFLLFSFSSFPPVIHFGLLSAITFIAALVTVLFFLPAALGSRRS